MEKMSALEILVTVSKHKTAGLGSGLKTVGKGLGKGLLYTAMLSPLIGMGATGYGAKKLYDNMDDSQKEFVRESWGKLREGETDTLMYDLGREARKVLGRSSRTLEPEDIFRAIKETLMEE